ncbi:RNA polymerase sigma factor [Nocardia sp. NPDC059240]|uniref:RNA polymerase sigma factor n=1 Tax=Nocardia sp. NPDC059240 TaxID=3346786 RepID=UPI003692BFBC
MSEPTVADPPVPRDPHYRQQSPFERLYRRDQRELYKFVVVALRGNTRNAEDLVHETFLRAWKRYRHGLLDKPVDEARGLLITIASHLVIDSWRAEDRRLDLVGDDLDELSDAGSHRHVPDTGDLAVDNVLMSQLWQVLSTELTAGEFRVAFLSWRMNLPDQQIATALRTTRRTVQAQRSTAKHKIKALLSDPRRRTEIWSAASDEVRDRGTASTKEVHP